MAFRFPFFTRNNYFRQQNFLRQIRARSTDINENTGRASSGGSTVNIPSKEIVTPQPPLNEPLRDLPPVTFVKSQIGQTQTQITTLSNGLRVASENRFGQFCSVGVVIDSGSRYEVAYPSGISHFLDKLAFNSTLEFESKDSILRELGKHGGVCDCQTSRDTTIYATSVDRLGLESVTRILAEVVLRPKLTDEEVQTARHTVAYELQALHMRPEQDILLSDMIHAAAYRDNTLGLPRLCPTENLDKIDRNVLLSYLRLHHTPSRMVVAGCGVDHEEFVQYVEKYFNDNKWNLETLNNSLNNSVTEVDTSVAQYTGGTVKELCEIPIYAACGLPEVAHIVIGLEGVSHQDPDFIPACVLNIMMGGGGSFSAGGPGKGMYARLYTNVLNRYHWMTSATALNHAYADTGVFMIHASAPPDNVRAMVEVITNELVAMTSEPGPKELRRAKTQLQSMLLMNLEARAVVFEDIGRQVLASGERKQPEYFISEIEKVTAEDIQRVARRLVGTPPSLAARGNIAGLPENKDIQTGLTNQGKLPKSGFAYLFR